MKVGTGVLHEVLDQLVVQAKRQQSNRLVNLVSVSGPRGSARWLVTVDGWALAVVRPDGYVLRLDPGIEAPSWARPPYCSECGALHSRDVLEVPYRPSTLLGVREAIMKCIGGAL